jgi:hypothetical protein
LLDWDFWFKGLVLCICLFLLGWWLWHVFTWFGIGFGAEMAGLGAEQAYSIWHTAVSATQTPFLQYFFLGTIPLSLLLVYRRFGGYLV